MKRNVCIECNKSTTNGVFILTGKGWIYEFYCINCTRAFLGKMANKEAPSFLKLTRQDLTNASRQYDSILYQSVPALKKDKVPFNLMPVHYKNYVLKRSEDR